MAKRVADLLTLSRFFLGGSIVVLGMLFGERSLPLIFTLLLVGWTSDALDGPLARSAPRPVHTWLGDNEALADTALTVSVLIAFTSCGYVAPWLAASYLLIAGAVIVHTRSSALNMAFLTVIHAFTLYVAFRYTGLWGWLIITWIVITLILDWKRFSDLVHIFLRGMSSLPAAEETAAEGNGNGSHAFLRN